MIVSSKIPSNISSCSALDYLSSRFTYLSSEDWIQRIGEGRIRVNGKQVSAECIIFPGDTLAYDMPDFQEPPADLNYRIIYDSPTILGIDKPGNLLVHHSGKSLRNNLIYQLRHVHEPAYPDFDIVNRLDRETSGVVLVARGAETLRALQTGFANREIRKKYRAIIHGSVAKNEGTIEAPIGKNRGSAISYKFTVDPESGKDASTSYVVRSRRKGYTLVDLFPATGRTHQLRVHMASLGNPIVGDKLYGMPETDYLAWRRNPRERDNLLEFPRQALHCISLEFTDPESGNRLKIEAPFAADLQSFWDSIEQAEGGAD